jgi:hypothetical protein
LAILGNSAGGDNGIVSGCAVTTNSNMTLAVAAGTVKVAGATAAVTGGNVTITTAHATLDRIDIVVVNGSGTKSVTAGTAATTPVQPALPASSVCLASIYVPAGDTVIGATQIVDRRIIVPAPVASGVWTEVLKTTDEIVNNSTTLQADDTLTFSMSANTVYRFEMFALLTIAAASDLKFGMTGPASPGPMQVVKEYGFTTGITQGKLNAYDTTGQLVTAGSTDSAMVALRGVIQNGANAGAWQFTWAQNVAIAENTICERGSWLHYSVV